MAEANQPNYGKIGCVLILGIACIVGALIWFGGAGSGKNYVRAETYFSSPVSGLAVGSDVCFRGVKIGTVSTQSQTAGINVIDLQYTGVGGVAMWSLLNTHSNIPT